MNHLLLIQFRCFISIADLAFLGLTSMRVSHNSTLSLNFPLLLIRENNRPTVAVRPYPGSDLFLSTQLFAPVLGSALPQTAGTRLPQHLGKVLGRDARGKAPGQHIRSAQSI